MVIIPAANDRRCRRSSVYATATAQERFRPYSSAWLRNVGVAGPQAACERQQHPARQQELRMPSHASGGRRCGHRLLPRHQQAHSEQSQARRGGQVEREVLDLDASRGCQAAVARHEFRQRSQQRHVAPRDGAGIDLPRRRTDEEERRGDERHWQPYRPARTTPEPGGRARINGRGWSLVGHAHTRLDTGRQMLQWRHGRGVRGSPRMATHRATEGQ